MSSTDINVISIDIDPNDCPLEAPLELTIKFEACRDLESTHWELFYVVDIILANRSITLTRTEKATYVKGTHSVTFHVEFAAALSGVCTAVF